VIVSPTTSKRARLLASEILWSNRELSERNDAITTDIAQALLNMGPQKPFATFLSRRVIARSSNSKSEIWNVLREAEKGNINEYIVLALRTLNSLPADLILEIVDHVLADETNLAHSELFSTFCTHVIHMLIYKQQEENRIPDDKEKTTITQLLQALEHIPDAEWDRCKVYELLAWTLYQRYGDEDAIREAITLSRSLCPDDERGDSIRDSLHELENALEEDEEDEEL
jgi:hypothetical protein